MFLKCSLDKDDDESQVIYIQPERVSALDIETVDDNNGARWDPATGYELCSFYVKALIDGTWVRVSRIYDAYWDAQEQQSELALYIDNLQAGKDETSDEDDD